MKPSCIIQPFSFEGQVIHGYGRGSKLLDCPTANVDAAILFSDGEVCWYRNGVYWGYASVENGPVYRCAINIGVCPYFKNDKRTFEVHLIDYDGPDFYGSRIHGHVHGYIRAEKADFDSFEALKDLIQEDLKWIKEQ